MNVLQIYALDINEFGELTKRLLARVYETGLVQGDSFLAGFLQSAVHKTMEPSVNLDYLQKLYTNGYYAAEIVNADKRVT